MTLNDCYNVEDFRKLAKKNLPAPIFHYIDGGSDDETTLKRNTESFLKCDLVPNILAGVGQPDLSTTVLGQKIDMPLFLSPAQERQKNLGLFIACQLWQHHLLKKLQMFQGDLKCFSFISTKIKA